MTSSVEESTCKYFSFRPEIDSDSETKVPIYGYLVFEDDCPVEKHTFPLEWKNFTIGRVKQSHLRVMTAITSRVHCVISCDHDEVPILFNKSGLNRTYVNDVMVETSTQLIDGASIKIGQHIFKFRAVETNSAQEDTVACETTMEENVGEEIKEKAQVKLEEVQDEEVEESEEMKHKEELPEPVEIKNEIKTGKRNGRKAVTKNNRQKAKKTVEVPEENLEEERKVESEPENEKDEPVNDKGNKINLVTPLSISEEKSEHEDISAAASASEEKSDQEDVSGHTSAMEEKDEDEDGSISVSANEEKVDDEPCSPSAHRGKNNLKVTFKPSKEDPKKSQPANTDAAVRRSSRRRPNASSQPTESVAEEQTEEPKKVKITKKATGVRRKKTNVEEEVEPVKEPEEKIVTEEKRPRRGKKAKVPVEETPEEPTVTKPVTRRLRSRK